MIKVIETQDKDTYCPQSEVSTVSFDGVIEIEGNEYLVYLKGENIMDEMDNRRVVLTDSDIFIGDDKIPMFNTPLDDENLTELLLNETY